MVDASALLEYLLQTPASPPIAAKLQQPGADLHMPALCDVEVAAGLRAAMRRGAIDGRRAEEAITDYLELPLTRHGHQRLLRRALSLRDNFSAYDAVYVALAERLAASLLTGDLRLARALRRHTDVASA